MAAGHNLVIFTNRNLRAQAIRIFDRTFAITYALEVVAVIVAIIGIAGALLALVIDRRRELGLLRFLGAAVAQIRKLILVEAGLIGLLANLAGLALGIVLSLLLIFVINKQSFGWTIQFHWPVAVLLGALTLVYVATVLAGFYPARVATCAESRSRWCMRSRLLRCSAAACSLACRSALAQYQQALPGYQYEFPRDHFNHPDYKTEWWYYTGNLKAADGHRFGFELTFFRQGVNRDRRKQRRLGRAGSLPRTSRAQRSGRRPASITRSG